jgi:Carboxypeptidase regulatory-like domain/TonB-dependent Receptor Plug Domain
VQASGVYRFRHSRFAGLILLGVSQVWSSGTLLHAQTTQGTVAGRVFDRHNAQPLAGARVIAYTPDNEVAAAVDSDSRGFYLLGLLSPNVYRIRAEKKGYQAQEVFNLELLAASQLTFTFQLRPEADLFGVDTNHFAMVGGNRIIPFYGEDTKLRLAPVEVIKSESTTLQPVVSAVIDSREIQSLPFAGRDIYAALALQAGITSDTTTGRGLGLSVNGQRPSASNYLLDGIDNNNYLVTGPLLTIAPEATQEYRISTNSFSVEYGGTAGFIANAVTRSGGNQWHGAGYFYLKNDLLNANDFQRNAAGLPTTPLRQSEPGLLFSGPLVKNRVYISGSGDYTHFRSNDAPQVYQLPVSGYQSYVPPGTIARTLLDRFSWPTVTGAPGQSTAETTIAPPSSESFDQWLGLARADVLFQGGRSRLMVRPLASGLVRPDFLWTPYKDFITPLRQTSAGIAASYITSLNRVSSETRFGFNWHDLDFARRWPDIPTLNSGDGTTLPGSPAFYGFKNTSRNIEFGEHLILPKGRHLLRFGGSAVLRHMQGYLNPGQDSLFAFSNFSAFAVDSPFLFTTSISRETPVIYSLPDFQRTYRYTQFALFAEDTFHMNSRLAFDLGIRYENFGAPVNVGSVKDALVQLGPGQDFGGRLATSKLIFPKGGDEQIYDRDNLDFALRGGFAYALQRKGKLVLRGSYGIYYDRPFDNLWNGIRNNSFTTTSFLITSPPPVNYLQPALNLLIPAYVGYPYSRNFPSLILYQPGLRNGYAQNYFLGLQYRPAENFTIEVNALGSLGRRLITTDLVNRRNSVPYVPGNITGQFNPSLPEMSYRGSQGNSNYNAVTIVARHRRGSLQFQVGYTLSRAIDNQSDPLAGDFFNLDFTRIVASIGGQNGFGFTRQFDSQGDRANADFDQRQNAVGYMIWSVPSWRQESRWAPLFRNWTLSALGAARSGFPYSVYVPPVLPPGSPELVNNRANILNPGNIYTGGVAYPGGQLLLNRDALGVPTAGQQGNSGRNAFRGPGLASLDASVSRSFSVEALDRTWRFTIRADAFNLLNHANLNNPNSFLTNSPTTSPTFGVATYGRLGDTTGFPAVAPFNETARQIQLSLRIAF